jgi:hypothetical protein
MATQAPVKTHCPTCGAKLHRQDLSLCAYCATPLSIGDARTGVDDETVKRLTRMRESPNYAAAMAFAPRDPEAAEKIARVRLIGGLQIPLAILFGAIGLAMSQENGARILMFALAAVALVDALIMIAVLPALMKKSEAARPMLRRPALVVSRRSEMIDKGRYGTTLYYFTLRFDDGSEGEFRWRGLGTLYEPMPNGATGMAYTSSERLIDFRKF